MLVGVGGVTGCSKLVDTPGICESSGRWCERGLTRPAKSDAASGQDVIDEPVASHLSKAGASHETGCDQHFVCGLKDSLEV